MTSSLPNTQVLFGINISSSIYERKNKEMSEQFEIRKLQAMGSRGTACMNTHIGPHSFASVIPQAYVEQLGLKKGDFVKLGLEGKRVWMEKLLQ